MRHIEGTAYKNELTKLLIHDLHNKCIAVIKHRGLDLPSAQELAEKKVRAVVNFSTSINEDNILGVQYLLEKNIKVFDCLYEDLFYKIMNGDKISIKDDKIYVNGVFICKCHGITNEDIELHNDRQYNKKEKIDFLYNTVDFINKELNYFLDFHDVPDIGISLKSREVLIVSRGRNYRNDIKQIKRFIADRRVIIIGVDGGADAVFDSGMYCNVVIGDMDSISDKSLRRCDEVIVHSYIDGYAPGLERIKNLGLKYSIFPIKGTSEDAALYMSYVKGASKIYLLGGHNSIEEFLEKGRKGMSSTILVRILIGDRLVDLKGIGDVMKYNQKKYTYASFILLFLFIVAAIYIYQNKLFADVLKAIIYSK